MYTGCPENIAKVEIIFYLRICRPSQLYTDIKTNMKLGIKILDSLDFKGRDGLGFGLTSPTHFFFFAARA